MLNSCVAVSAGGEMDELEEALALLANVAPASARDVRVGRAGRGRPAKVREDNKGGHSHWRRVKAKLQKQKQKVAVDVFERLETTTVQSSVLVRVR